MPDKLFQYELGSKLGSIKDLLSPGVSKRFEAVLLVSESFFLTWSESEWKDEETLFFAPRSETYFVFLLGLPLHSFHRSNCRPDERTHRTSGFGTDSGLNSVMQVDYIRGDVSRGLSLIGQTSLWICHLSLWMMAPAPGLISLGTLGNWEMTSEPASCVNKIWESRWWEVTCTVSLPRFPDGATSCLASQVTWKERDDGGSEPNISGCSLESCPTCSHVHHVASLAPQEQELNVLPVDPTERFDERVKLELLNVT